MSGYFKIWRELFDKPIWLNSTPEQKTVLISIIKMANWKENSWEWNKKTYHCKAGEFITSYSKICETCGKGVTHQNVRTALKRFQNLEFLTYQTTVGEYGGIKVIITNWDKYQDETNTSTNTSLTHHQHISNTSLTTIEEVKKVRNKEVVVIGKQPQQKKFIPPSVEEVREFCKERNNGIDAERFWHYYNSKGWKVGKETMKKWQSAVITWEKQDAKSKATATDDHIQAAIQRMKERNNESINCL
jgi:hypothetical protein